MKKRYKILLMSVVLGVCAAMLGCGSEEQNNTQVDFIPTATPTAISTDVPVNTATPTIKPTNTMRPTNTPKPTNTPTPTFIPEPDPDGEFFNASSALDKKLGAYYAGVLADAEVSKGNAYRLAKKLDAAKEGKQTTVLFIGGSVTEGSNASERTPQGYQKGYAYITYEYLRDTYGVNGGSNFKYVNAGISGTSSALGINRVEDDVLSFNPDIIFIEFAVNNDSRIAYDNQSYESLVRRCLNAEGEPAVILLFSAATYAGGTQAVMEKIGAFYDLTMVSMHNALKTPQNKKVIAWADFSKDSVHPQQAGHYLYARAICKTLKHAYEENTSDSYTVPTTVSKEGYGDYENLHMINNTNAEGYITDLGCFQASNTKHATSGNSDSFALEKGWVKRSDAENKPMVITLECKSFHVVVKQVNAKTDVDFDIYVDGEKTSTITTSKSGAWNNAFAYVVFDSKETKLHTIEIRPNDSSVSANATILSLGYCADENDDGNDTESTDSTNSIVDNDSLKYSKVEREDVATSPFHLKLEAEDGVLAGNLSVASSRAGYSGTGYVTNFNQKSNNSWTMTFEVPEEGFYKITVYTSANEHKVNALNVNGVDVGTFTDDSKKFTSTEFEGIFLKKGENVISITEQWGWFDLDMVEIDSSTALSNSYYNGISSELANKNANEKTKKIMEYLVSIYGNYTLTGQYCDNGVNTEIDAIYKATGKYPAVRGFDFIFMSPNSSYKTTVELDRAKEWAKAGGLCTFSWHWHSPVGASEFYTDSTDFKLSKAVSSLDLATKSAKEIKTMYENGELSKEQYRLIADIDTISFYLKQLQDEGITVLWRPLHEASGGWFWWGADGKDSYLWLWKFMFIRQTEYHKLNNLIWIWNGQDNAWYPGDEYVDIVGTDIYLNAYDYSSSVASLMNTMDSANGRKLTALTENGVIPSPELCVRDNAYWLWFNTWCRDFMVDSKGNLNETKTSTEMLKKAYASDLYITRDELPDFNK